MPFLAIVFLIDQSLDVENAAIMPVSDRFYSGEIFICVSLLLLYFILSSIPVILKTAVQCEIQLLQFTGDFSAYLLIDLF